MSIYATLWVVKFPRHGDSHLGCDWVQVLGQGVPAHIGTPSPGYGNESEDPFESFLPPPIPMPEDDDGTTLRAFVIVRDGTEKVGQEYVHPLLVLSGREYATIPFAELHDRICDALRGSRPRVTIQYTDRDGHTRLIFEDGSTRELRSEDCDDCN